MTLKRFVALSIVIHAAIALSIFFFPVAREEKKQEMLTRLVSPDELKRAEQTPSLSGTPLREMKPAPARRLPNTRKISPQLPPVLERPLTPESPDMPLVPGEGKDTGSSLPEGILSKPASGDTTQGKGSKDEGNAAEKAIPGFSTREALFDRKTIEEIARGHSTGPFKQKKKEDNITFDTADYRYSGYMNKLRSKIESIWEYPPEAQSRGLYGDLKIRFTIKKDGRLGEIQLVRTSGHKMLDDAAIRALREGQPYWPLPDEWKMETYTILGHFIYSLHGYQLR